MENFFIRSVEHILDTDFLWSDGYIAKDKCIFKDTDKVLSLSFKPTHFQVLEHNFLLFDHKRLFIVDKSGNEEFVGTLETEPIITTFNAEESLLVIVLANKCLLLNTYFELINTYPLTSKVCDVEWNQHAHLIYCATQESVLIFNNKLEFVKSLECGGPISLRTANILGVAHGTKVRFFERNGLEFGDPLTILRDEGSESACRHIQFLDRNTLVVVSNYLSIYFFKNSVWYEKARFQMAGKFLGIIKNKVYLEDKGLVVVRIFKEFTKSQNTFFVINGNSILLYDYHVSIVPPPFCDKTIKFAGTVADISSTPDKLCILLLQQNDEICSKHAVLDFYALKSLEKLHEINVSFIKDCILEVILLPDSVLARTSNDIYSIETKSGQIRYQTRVKNIIKMYFFTEILLLDIEGNLYKMDKYLQRSSTLFYRKKDKDEDILYYDVNFYNGAYFLQINSQLFFMDFSMSRIVSFLVHEGFLIVTRHISLSFIKVDDLVRQKADDETPIEIQVADDMVMERNAQILTYASSLILYIPRGNIESFKLRPVIAEDVKKNILQGKYNEAMDLCIRNCLAFDLWFNFDINLNELARLTRSSLTMFFSEIFKLLKLSEHDPEDVIVSLKLTGLMGQMEGARLASSVEKETESTWRHHGHTNIFLSSGTNAVKLLCDLFRVIDTDVLVEVLVKLKLFPIALAISRNLNDFVKLAASYTTPDDLIKKSLLIYDLDLSSKIATMLDKKSYVEEFKGMRGDNEKFRILDYLKLRKRALDILINGSEARLSYNEDGTLEDKDYVKIVCEYIEKYNLYEYALKYNCDVFIELYAKKLFDLKSYEKCFDLYRKVDLKKALAVSFHLASSYTIEVAGQLGILDTDFYRKLVASLVDRGRFEEAAYIKRDLLCENALSYFLHASKPSESLAELRKQVEISKASIEEDALYKEFITKMREIEAVEKERLAKKTLQINKYLERMKCLDERPCDFSATTFSYSVSGSNVKMNEEDFVRKRLSDLGSEILASKAQEIARVIREVGHESDLDADYKKIVDMLGERAVFD
jgi:hypothetical protein